MKRLIKLSFLLSLVIAPSVLLNAQTTRESIPIFKNGEAQIVPAFADPTKWIRHDLWVETEFNTDGDGN
jgi:X-Pro dipeptidyl-peptidase